MVDWVSGLLQGLFANLLWALLLAVGVGAAIAYLKATATKWAGPTIYGLAGFTLVLVIAFTVTGHGLLAKVPVEITPDNLDANLRTWLDDFQMGVRRTDNSTVYFRYDVTLPSVGLTVERPRQHDKYLAVGGALVMNDAQKAALKKLTVNQMGQMVHSLSRQLAQSNLAVINNFPDNVTVETGIPITSAMNEDEVIKTIQSVENALVAARETLQLEVFQLGIPSTNFGTP